MKKEWTVQWSKGKSNISDAYYVRALVFMVEQGFRDDFDEQDAHSWHVIVYDGDEPVGTGRVFEKDGQWHAGRISVLEPYRKKGVGRVVMEQLEEKVREQGGHSLLLSAQCTAAGFYRRCGYRDQGEVYNDIHCPHIDMLKSF